MRLACSICLSVFLLVVASSLGLAQSKGDANAGKTKYESLCAGCHGKTGKGDGPAAASLNPKPQDHTDGKTMNALTDKYLADIVKDGGAGVKKSPLMPAWGKTMKDQEIADVVAYIRSLANPPYKPGK
jgi:mono/diheme cytochrome c family protein